MRVWFPFLYLVVATFQLGFIYSISYYKAEVFKFACSDDSRIKAALTDLCGNSEVTNEGLAISILAFYVLLCAGYLLTMVVISLVSQSHKSILWDSEFHDFFTTLGLSVPLHRSL